MYFAPLLKGFPLELGTGAGGQKLERQGYRAEKEIWRMVPLLMTLSGIWPGFQSHDIFDIEYLRNNTR